MLETVLHGITVQGSLVGAREDLAGTFALDRRGTIRLVAERRSLDDVNAVPARLVFDLT